MIQPILQRLPRLIILAALVLTACAFPTLPLKIGQPPAAVPAAGTPGPTSVAGGEPASTGSEAAVRAQPGSLTQLTAKDASDPANPLRGLILFTSAAANPFERLAVTEAQVPTEERHLWAVSLDGERAGRLSPDGYGSALFVAQKAAQNNRVVTYGFSLTGDRFEPVAPPVECELPAGQPFDAANPPCGNFQFTSDGQSLSYLSGPDACGRTLTRLDLITNKTTNTWNNVHWYYTLTNGSMVISMGDCESQVAYMYIPKTGKQAGIYQVGTPYWNPNHTAVIFRVQGKSVAQPALWGFNIETSRVFIWPPENEAIEETPVWLADGKHFVFQHRDFHYDASSKEMQLNGPRQIILMDAWTQSQKLLAYAYASDYHLCQTTGEPCDQPYGDWIQVQRAPFKPAHFPFVDQDGKLEVRCALYGVDCKEPLEQIAINWKTGNQYPWAEASVPTPDASAPESYRVPDRSAEPLFKDPAGGFEFTLGKDGKSLWYIAAGEEPVLWVKDGEGFIYLP